MSLGIYKARVTEKQLFNNKFLKVHLELVDPPRIEFAAGQYMLLSVPGVDEKKSYSITSTPDMSHAVEMLVDVTPGGTGSDYLRDVEIGADVEFRAPVGHFVVAEDGAERLVFVATGSGISPIHAMILDQLLNKKDTRPITLYWGLRSVEEMFWEEDFNQLDSEYENFAMEIILSQPPEGWKLSQGYVTDLLDKRIEDYTKAGYYLCGNSEMINDAKELLAGKGVNESLVYTEKFY